MQKASIVFGSIEVKLKLGPDMDDITSELEKGKNDPGEAQYQWKRYLQCKPICKDNPCSTKKCQYHDGAKHFSGVGWDQKIIQQKIACKCGMEKDTRCSWGYGCMLEILNP